MGIPTFDAIRSATPGILAQPPQTRIWSGCSRPPPELGSEEPADLADLSALASLAGCPALSLPLPGGIGLQLVGAPGSDLRLLELGEILAAVLDAGA